MKRGVIELSLGEYVAMFMDLLDFMDLTNLLVKYTCLIL